MVMVEENRGNDKQPDGKQRQEGTAPPVRAHMDVSFHVTTVPFWPCDLERRLPATAGDACS